ncbi:MAG: YybS family protein [Desulfuromonadales bacterium]|nr:YybS family protein [Desulfuromonadales bacterium]
MQRGLYVVLGGLAGYALFGSFAALGFAAVAVNLLAPLPAAFVGMRFGSKAGVVTVGLTALLVLLANGLSPALMYLVQFGIPGAGLPYLLNRGVAWDKATAAVLLGMVVVSLCGLLVVSAVAGQSPLATVSDLIGKEITQTTTVMQEMFAGTDLPASQKKDVGLAVEKMMDFLRKAYPGIAITVSGLMTVGLVFLLSVLARGRYTVPGKAFPEWKTPEKLVWVLIVAGFLVAFVDSWPGTLALNLLVILLPVYFLQGLAVIDCFFRRKAFSPIIRAVGYLLVTLVNPLPMVVTGLGIFDLWADFRKPKEPKS